MVKYIILFFIVATFASANVQAISAEESSVESIRITKRSLGITDKQLAQMIENGEIPQNVTSLWLPGNQITDISPLSALTNLRELNLNSNQIEDLTPLRDMTNLKMLYLGDNQIVDISPLGGLTNLQSLSLESNRISDITPLSKLVNLGKNQFVSGLDLGNNQITDITPLSGLIHLPGLNINNNLITDLTPLYPLKNLTFYTLFDNPVTDEQIAELKKELRKADFFMGKILGGEEITILDALEILMYLAGLDSVIEEGNNAWFASLITGKDTPTINDALEILMHLAGMESVLG